mmetsp:Transcript_19187/g.73721  ORF Transcript_19187/g.73721 Transcript_19187/m.73721 type:complete len:227 (-) Transcript_19187:1091-1771(-)
MVPLAFSLWRRFQRTPLGSWIPLSETHTDLPWLQCRPRRLQSTASQIRMTASESSCRGPAAGLASHCGSPQSTIGGRPSSRRSTCLLQYYQVLFSTLPSARYKCRVGWWRLPPSSTRQQFCCGLLCCSVALRRDSFASGHSRRSPWSGPGQWAGSTSSSSCWAPLSRLSMTTRTGSTLCGLPCRCCWPLQFDCRRKTPAGGWTGAWKLSSMSPLSFGRCSCTWPPS